jgi:hypothetical protein
VHGYAQYMIDQARAHGYQLVRLGECLGDPEANWYRNGTTGQAWTPAGVKLGVKASAAGNGTATSSPVVTPTAAAGGGIFGAGTGNGSSTASTSSIVVSTATKAAQTASPSVTSKSEAAPGVGASFARVIPAFLLLLVLC